MRRGASWDFAAGDKAYGFISAHAANLPGGIHGAQDGAAPAQQEFGGLDVTTTVLGPPSIEQVGVGFGCAVGYVEGQPLVLDLLRLLFVIDADSVDRDSQFVQLFLVRFPFG